MGSSILPAGTMDWSSEQQQALRDAQTWLRAPLDLNRQIYAIFGFAGTGKTTIAKYLAADSGLRVVFASYTGKATHVMRQKGCDPCRTLHSLIYKPAGESKSDALKKVESQLMELTLRPNPDPLEHTRLRAQLTKRREELLMRDRPQPMFSLNIESELTDFDVLIVDEASMVDQQMGEDILSFRKKVLVLGDPAQLPPVGSGGFFTKREPDHLLSQIHRHAAESGILRMATDIRTTGSYIHEPGAYGDDVILGPKHKLENLQQLVLDADQVLVGRNATRHAANQRYRKLIGRESPFVEAGDKVVCLKNESKKGLLNGSLWRVHEAVVDQDTMLVDLTVSSEEDQLMAVTTRAWAHHFVGREGELALKGFKRRDFSEFDFGATLTVHKSQGSQWDSVVLFDESGAFRNDARKWMYTGVTRAAKKLVVGW